MKKIKVSADTALKIITSIMQDENINYILDDKSAPIEWQGKRIGDILNVEYYSFKHRPMDTELLVQKLMKDGDYNSLYSLSRSFCILSLSSTERVFSKNVDILTTTANLEYWIQTEKVKVLEDMLEDMAVATNGIRIPVRMGAEDRQVLVAMGNLSTIELNEVTEYGEMSVCEIAISLVFYPNAISISDYTVEMYMPADQYSDEEYVTLPISSIAFSANMTQKAIPLANTPHEVANINLSKVKSIVLTFGGYRNRAIDFLASMAMSTGGEYDNNTLIRLRVTRGEDMYIYDCIVKDHTIITQEGSENETHSLTVSIRGIR